MPCVVMATHLRSISDTEKKVFNCELKENYKMLFYRLNVIDFYNNNTGNVDIADQLRNHYRYETNLV